MSTNEITIRVDSKIADAYHAASENDRRKLDLFVSLQLQDALRSGELLETVMSDIRRRARERGLTPELLETMLREP